MSWHFFVYFSYYDDIIKTWVTLNPLSRGEQYLLGENLKVVWAQFSALSLTVLLNSYSKLSVMHTDTSRVEILAQGCPFSLGLSVSPPSPIAPIFFTLKEKQFYNHNFEVIIIYLRDAVLG
jgi:hypothetical protein